MTKSQKNSNLLFTLDNGEEVRLEDVLKKIYLNSEEKKQHMLATAEHIGTLIKSISDAVIIMPMLVDLQKASIQNDDMMVKMATLAQRGINAKPKNSGDSEELISAEEIKMIMAKAKDQRDLVPGSSAGDE